MTSCLAAGQSREEDIMQIVLRTIAAAAVCAVCVPLTLVGCQAQREARILTESEVAALDMLTPQVEAALDAFSKTDDKGRSDALNFLMTLRPLPSAAREKLRLMIQGGNDWVREYGPKVLAYHHVGSVADHAAIEKLADSETVGRLKTQHQAVLTHLVTPAPAASVIADSAPLDASLSDALMEAIQKPGRSLWSTVMSARGPDGVKVEGSVSAQIGDLPEVLAVGGGEVTLGWQWEARFSDDAAKVSSQSAFSTEITYNRSNTTPEVAPVGVVLYVNRPITFGNSALPAGSVLVKSDFGWSRVETATALQWLDNQLHSTADLGYPVPATAPAAAIGIAALGPKAKNLLPALVGLGTDTKTLVYRLRALARIHDASVIPELQRWKIDLKDQSGLFEAVEETIAQIQK